MEHLHERPRNFRRRIRATTRGKTKTDQSQTATTDINKIMARYKKTGVVSSWNHKQPTYGDVSMVTDFREAVELAGDTWDHFMELDAEIRGAADNDPGIFLSMLTSPEGTQALVDAGLEVEGLSRSEPPAKAEAPEEAAEPPPSGPEGEPVS